MRLVRGDINFKECCTSLASNFCHFEGVHLTRFRIFSILGVIVIGCVTTRVSYLKDALLHLAPFIDL